MASFDPGSVSVSVSPGTQNHPQRIAQGGVVAARSVEGIIITAINNNQSSLEWLSVDIAQYISKTEYTRTTGDHVGDTTTDKGWESITIKFGRIKSGETVTHFAEWWSIRKSHSFSVWNGKWVLHQIYGKPEGQEPFVRQDRTDITVGVKHTVKPNGTCFVATAAYKDPNHPIVDQLRFLRDRVLVRSVSGRRCISAYNRFGPRIADVVRPNEFLCFAFRVALAPIGLAVWGARLMARAWQAARLTGR